MQKKKIIKKIIFTIICLLVIISVCYIVVYFTNTVIVTNYLKNGIVDIEIQEYTINSNGEKVKWENKKNIVPGEKICKISQISCAKGSADCYIRAKIDIKLKNEENNNILTIDDLNIDKGKWYYCENDGFWYYKEVLTDNDEDAILYTQVNLPANYNNEYVLEEFEISVKVEAIQAKNITLNFNNDSTEPWLGINQNDIEEYKYPNHVK